MTYLERIVYLVGELVEVSQYALKNAFRVASLYEASIRMNEYTKGQEMLLAAEGESKQKLEDYEFEGSDSILFYLKDKGISEKDYKTLSKVLKRKDYVNVFFFVEKGPDFALEDVHVYENTIRELEEDIERAKKLSISLSKTAESFYQM